MRADTVCPYSVPFQTPSQLPASLVKHLLGSSCKTLRHSVQLLAAASSERDCALHGLLNLTDCYLQDHRLLCKFWESTAERRRLRQALPDCADRVLVFHRCGWGCIWKVV